MVGAPVYFAIHAPPRTPHELQAHACIERRYPGGAHYAWEFGRDGETVEIEVSGPLVVDDPALMITAAQAGLGLAFVYENQVADQIANGDLIRTLADWCSRLPRFFLYYVGRRQLQPPLRAFIDMVRAEPD